MIFFFYYFNTSIPVKPLSVSSFSFFLLFFLLTFIFVLCQPLIFPFPSYFTWFPSVLSRVHSFSQPYIYLFIFSTFVFARFTFCFVLFLPYYPSFSFFSFISPSVTFYAALVHQPSILGTKFFRYIFLPPSRIL